MHEMGRKIYEFNNFRLDVFERRLLKDKRPVAIPPKAFDLLVVLVENSGSLIERETLYAQLWPESIVEDANLTVQISAIRKALEKPSCISTVSGHGYRFTWSVTEVNGRAAPEPGVITPSATRLGSVTQPEDHESKGPTHDASNRNSFTTGFIGLMLVMTLGVGTYIYYGSGAASRIESIAVMPFLNETGDPDLDYLSDGMTVSVMSSLSKVPGVSVKARSSVFR